MGKERSPSKKPLTSKDKSSKSPVKRKKSPRSIVKDRNCGRIFAAVLTRILFAIHAGIALWRVSVYYTRTHLYLLSVGLILLAVEMIFTVIIRKGREYKWFCPSVLFYLMTVVPCLWVLEIARFKDSMDQATSADVCDTSLLSYQQSYALLQTLGSSELASDSTNRSRRHIFSSQSRIIPEMSQQFASRVKRSDDRIFSNKTVKTLQERVLLTSTIPAVYSPSQHSKLITSHENSTLKTASAYVSDSKADEISTRLTTLSSIATLRNELSAKTPRDSATHQPTRNLNQADVSRVSSTTLAIPSQTDDSLSSDEGGDGEMNVVSIRDQINDGFTNLKHGTEDLLEKTKKIISDFDSGIDLDTWILLLHQVLLFVLVIGRWLLPKGDITRDQLSQLLLVFIGVGADILEFVTETIDGDELDQTSCDVILHSVIYAVWSWSLLQFTLVLTASKSRKTRLGFEDQAVTTNTKGCCGKSMFADADVWGILSTLFLQDAPFLATRLYILIQYDIHHQMMIFFTGKNALVVVLQIYRIIVLKLKKSRPDDNIEESELEPLRGTLQRLAKRATAGDTKGGDVRDASFKRRNDGSVVVKIHLEDEGSMKRKNKKTSF